MHEQPNGGPERDLIEKLRQADEVLRDQRLSLAADQRIIGLLRQRGQRAAATAARRWWPVWLPAALTAVALTLWLTVDRAGRRRPLPTAPAPITVAGFRVLGGSAQTAAGAADTLSCRSSRCRLQPVDVPSRTDLALERSARVRRRGRDLELLRGSMRCDVAPRPAAAPPLRIHVSHGRIEVIGTRFALQHQAEGGWVELQRGSIRFVGQPRDGQPARVVRMRPGDKLRWPLPAARDEGASAATQPTSTAASHPARPRRAAKEPETAPDLLVETERLRSRGRFREAAALLRRGLTRVAGRAARERLSFELGEILTHQLRDVPAACRHWRRHLKRFGVERYGEQIAAARRQLGCPAPRR